MMSISIFRYDIRYFDIRYYYAIAIYFFKDKYYLPAVIKVLQIIDEF